MEKILTLGQIAETCGARLENCSFDKIVSDVVTDSRKVSEGSVFVALKGERFDGHSFVQTVLQQGAVCCVVDSSFENANNCAVLVVEDTFKALREIAELYRSLFEVPSVAITGSVGKTSTKDMIACVLENKFKVLKTQGNFNNEIGLPLTVFGMEKSHEIAVFEMGMSDFGEISRLTAIAKPHTAVLTNIGMSHIEHLGSQENIRKAKLEILEGMNPDTGCVILNGDDSLLWEVSKKLGFETLSYGIENRECDIVAENIKKDSEGSSFDVKVDGEKYSVRVNTPGGHHIYNALAAVLTGIRYGMSMKSIIEGIGNFVPQGLRQNIEVLDEYIIIRDCYNASPTSMKSGLEVLSVTAPKNPDKPYRKVAVLGDMLELGEYSETAHKSVGGMVCDYGADLLVAVGPNAENIAKGAAEKGFSSEYIKTFRDNASAKEELLELLHNNDVIMFKASRGMKLEELADFVAKKD